jgi:RNA exonuclease 1
MFQSSGLFKNIPCPNKSEKCKLPSCIFSHSIQVKANVQNGLQNATFSKTSDYDVGRPSGDHKRLKLDNGSKYVRSLDETEQNAKPAQQPFVGSLTARPTIPRATSSVRSENHNEGKYEDKAKPLASTTRPISPPPISSYTQKATTNGKPVISTSTKPRIEKVETLTPRMLAKPPTNFKIRYAILQKLHEAMTRLNKEVVISTDKNASALRLSDNELIRLALDEEEQVALGPMSIYTNVIKQRIVRYQKMKLAEWIDFRLEAVKKEIEKANPPSQKPAEAKPYAPVKTGLMPIQELAMLKRFILSPGQLKQAEYITSLPTDAEIAEEKKTAASSMGYEPCDRCGTRFQVFPDRREDGALTSNGKCMHHWGKPVYPKREKTDLATGTLREPHYGCCSEPIGSPGCTAGETHVFKTSSPKRLAAVLQFEETPPNSKADPDLAVSFDCEMAYTTYGLELIRLSATTWPQGEALIDVLVRPIGQVLDLNTRFSGVTSEQFLNAVEYDPEWEPLPTPPKKTRETKGFKESKRPQPIPMVPSPVAARWLLFSYINPETVLIGHALSNDTNVMRIVHPNIVDTSLLYPHPAGLPIRYALRNLAKQFLNMIIQTAGASGHDSLEDSRATGELVLLKVAKEWEELGRSGWSSRDGKFYAPLNKEEPATLPPYVKSQGHLKRKRKAEPDGAASLGASAALAELKQRSLDIEQEVKKNGFNDGAGA